MGSVILANLAFEEVEYVLCETFELQEQVKKYYEDKTIYQFDQIYITDLSLLNPMLEIIMKDIKLKDKFFIFDHHKTALKEEITKYDCVTIKICDENGLCSGTSLFYQYLVKKNLLPSNSKGIFEFQESTRRYDTWEWKTKYNDELAHELTLLFYSVGCNGYISLLTDKLKKDSTTTFSLNEFERMVVEQQKKKIDAKVSKYASSIIYREIQGKKAGIAFIDYESRNDLAEYLRTEGYEMDFCMMISLDAGSVSYRSIKDEVNVRVIAESFGGGGHDKASSSPISEELRTLFVDKLMEK